MAVSKPGAAIPRRRARRSCRRGSTVSSATRPASPRSIVCWPASQVTKRKISGGTRSDAGRDCRYGFLGLLKTCGKNGIEFWDYLGARLKVPGCRHIPALAEIVSARAPRPPVTQKDINPLIRNHKLQKNGI
jgi:hypothetical protein